jgi:hypothetical protein
MSVNFIAYIRRDIPDPTSVTPRETTHLDGCFDKPEYHATDSPVFLREIKEKHEVIVWVFSRIKLGKKILPPALDSKMILTSRVNPESEFLSERERQLLEQYKYVLRADPARSEYFAWRDATSVLTKALLKLNAPQRASLGFYFRGGRKVAPEITELMQFHAKSITEGSKAFVSYKWRDGIHEA